MMMGSTLPIHDKPLGLPWPVRPRPISGEATLGFMMRAARANGYESLRQLHAAVKSVDVLCEGVRLSLPERKFLFGPHPSYWGSNDFSLGLVAADFNHHLMRWCPLCLGESAHLRGQWMLKLCCVCSLHSIRLHDRCPVCGLAQRLERTEFERCACGARLAAAPVQIAAAPLLHVTRAIEVSIFGNSDSAPALPILSAPDWLRLASYLGQFSETFQPARPGKIANLHKLEQATALMFGVSGLLDNWPVNFHAVLAAIQHKVEATPSIRRAFGTLYRVLYYDLRSDGFQFLRDEFERYLRTHWWGVVCKRNRSFKRQTVAEHPRMTLKQAAHLAGVAPSTVRRFMQAELIPGEQFVFPSGRKARSIHRDDLVQLATLANDCLTISEAARQLALPERRVRELIAGGVIAPLVSRIHDKAGAWLIPTQAIRALGFAGRVFDTSSSITVGRLLRFWRLLDGEFIALVQAMTSKHLVPIGTESESVPLGHVALDVSSVRNWLSSYRRASGSSMTIDQAAQRLGLKQQVAYDLAQRGLLATVKEQSKGRRVEPEELEVFRSTYISLAELSRHLQHGPKWVLQNIRATPVTGPSVDGCRQYFFRRSEISSLMGQPAT